MNTMLLIISSGILVYCLFVLTVGFRSYRLELIKQRLVKIESSKIVDNTMYEDIPFVERIIKPTIDSIVEMFTKIIPISKKDQEALGRQLLQAGIRMNPVNYSAMRVMILILFVVVFVLLSIQRFGFNLLYIAIAAIMGLYSGYVILRFTLASRITNRQEKIHKQFPEFLDLLSVCVEAGLGFDQAVNYVSKEYVGEISEEFRIMLRDINLGSSRKQALSALQTRVPLEQLKTFSAAVIQADEMGISLKNILNVQAANVRLRYKQKIEEKAQTLSIKILFPMVLFIFPVIFIIILGPAVPSLMDLFGN